AGEFECESVRLLEHGPVRSIIRVESRYGDSTLREDYIVAANAPYVDVRVTIDWREKLALLKLRYPTSVETEKATFEVPYGAIELNQPAFGLIEAFHDRPLPQRDSHGDDGGADVVVTAVKGAEDGKGFVVRAYESAGRASRARFEILGRVIDADFGANEIKT